MSYQLKVTYEKDTPTVNFFAVVCSIRNLYSLNFACEKECHGRQVFLFQSSNHTQMNINAMQTICSGFGEVKGIETFETFDGESLIIFGKFQKDVRRSIFGTTTICL